MTTKSFRQETYSELYVLSTYFKAEFHFSILSGASLPLVTINNMHNVTETFDSDEVP